MDYDDFVQAIRREVDAVIEGATNHLGVAVPSCPGWTVADLLRHLGTLHWWWAQAVERGDLLPVLRRDAPPPPAEEELLLAWYRARADSLLARLEHATPDAPCWTFVGPGGAAFWARRGANELSVHRWDVELATKRSPSPIDASLAADGIDEYVSLFAALRGVPEGHDGATIHLHCTDVPGEWLVRFDDGHAVVTHEHAKGDVAARGAASDLLLCLWRRKQLDEVDVFGDRALLEAFAVRVGA